MRTRHILAALLTSALLLLPRGAAIAQFNAPQTWGGAAGGTGNAQTVTIKGVAALADLVGVPIRFLPVAANSGATTLTVTGSSGPLTSTAITRPSVAGAVALQGAELQPTVYAEVVYDGTQFQLVSHLSCVFKQRIVETSSTTYTPSAGFCRADVTTVGGGGGGGGAVATGGGQASAGGGAGSGARGYRTVTPAQVGASQSVTVGNAGTGVSGSNGNSGSASSFGSLCSSPGGSGGVASGASSTTVFGGAGGGGGTPTGCDVSIPGSGGTQGQANITSGFTIQGIGGLGFLAGGQIPEGAVATTAGFGGGGNGVDNSPNTSAQAGATGAPGVVIIDEYVFN